MSGKAFEERPFRAPESVFWKVGLTRYTALIIVQKELSGADPLKISNTRKSNWCSSSSTQQSQRHGSTPACQEARDICLCFTEISVLYSNNEIEFVITLASNTKLIIGKELYLDINFTQCI